MNHLFRYDAQPRLIAFLQDRLNVRMELPQLNVSPRMELTLSASMRDKLERKCADEFAVWEAGQG